MPEPASPIIPPALQRDEQIALLAHEVAQIWGEDERWLPSPTRWVQYEEDLGERSLVDFESGEVYVQLLISQETDSLDDRVIDHLRQGVRNLILRSPSDPVEMVTILSDQKKRRNEKGEIKVPTLKDHGNSKKRVSSSHDLTLDRKPSPPSPNPVILDQIRQPNGNRVTADTVLEFAAEVVKKKKITTLSVKGKDGAVRKSATVRFNLAANHLEIRARKYYPMVKAQATKHGVDPSLIMGIIHTESMFNPRARSHAPAYGLMQLVPKTGAFEAYQKLYGKKRKLSSEYLYNPDNNIELGVVYFNILQNRYMKKIENPESRTFCAVAAYNAGAANVGRAFISRKSMNKASGIINKMEALEVYDRLVANALSKETRKYVRKVLTRSCLYTDWKDNPS